MQADPTSEDTIGVERRLLQALCQVSVETSVKQVIQDTLQNYRWCDPVHHAIFAILVSLPAAKPALIREQLPARLTRKGFPDFDLADLFTSRSFSAEEVKLLLRQLRALRE